MFSGQFQMPHMFGGVFSRAFDKEKDEVPKTVKRVENWYKKEGKTGKGREDDKTEKQSDPIPKKEDENKQEDEHQAEERKKKEQEQAELEKVNCISCAGIVSCPLFLHRKRIIEEWRPHDITRCDCIDLHFEKKNPLRSRSAHNILQVTGSVFGQDVSLQ